MKVVVIGGTGLIGSKLVVELRERGHEAAPAAPNTGVNSLTGEGLEDVLEGATVVVDVSNSPSFADEPVMEFFRTSTSNVLQAEDAAGVRHHVGISIVGTERLPDNAYFAAKIAQEELIKASGIPYSLVHATQFFEFVGPTADEATWDDGKVHIAFYRQADPLTFAHVLVHESVHGFVHRFRAPPSLPSWVNEGLAETIASELVPRAARANETTNRARASLQQYSGMGGMLDARQISPWQYPVAETLCAFMIRQNKRNYVDFVVGIKEGLTWEESLEQRYKAPRDRLVRAYGESINLHGLKE